MKPRKIPSILLLPALLPILSFRLIPIPPPSCLSFIAYDHPPPSPASPRHLQSFLSARNHPFINCAQNCSNLVNSICTGAIPPISLAGRLGPHSTCLRSMMYMLTTSQPPPAYYNRHESFEDYFLRVRGRTDCALLDYYDGRGKACADDFDVLDRVQTIRDRFDEVHDLVSGGGQIGDLVWDNINLHVAKSERHIGDVAWMRGEELLHKAFRSVETKRPLCL